ncbi:MAG TPA: hypothetical protein VNA89_03125, partial [Gemmatimonadaceae bacterium]|nr:hypothetical protein [Gemmatimonadaceae bacterium]
MTRRSGLWRVLAWLFTLANLAGAGFAAMRGEGLHTAVHVGLVVLGATLVWWLGLRAGRRDLA